jgi:hypothetical protein
MVALLAVVGVADGLQVCLHDLEPSRERRSSIGELIMLLGAWLECDLLSCH